MNNINIESDNKPKICLDLFNILKKNLELNGKEFMVLQMIILPIILYYQIIPFQII